MNDCQRDVISPNISFFLDPRSKHQYTSIVKLPPRHLLPQNSSYTSIPLPINFPRQPPWAPQIGNSGFFFLTVFALTRIVGTCCDRATIKNASTGLFIAAAICSSIGLSLLMLAYTGPLSGT